MRRDEQNFTVTTDSAYADRLHRVAETPWKKLLDVQRPYRWNLKRLDLGRTLDIGCGIGRNLRNLATSSVGVDHNFQAIEYAKERGLTAYHVDDFPSSPDARTASFDALLVAHVFEHIETNAADDLLNEYSPYLRDGGKLVIITPQEVGFRMDRTHIRFSDFDVLRGHVERLGFATQQCYSFPFPRFMGRIFTYNEFVVVARKTR